MKEKLLIERLHGWWKQDTLCLSCWDVLSITPEQIVGNYCMFHYNYILLDEKIELSWEDEISLIIYTSQKVMTHGNSALNTVCLSGCEDLKVTWFKQFLHVWEYTVSGWFIGILFPWF